MSYVFHGLLQFILARIARVSRKGWVTHPLPMKRLPFGCICRRSANAGKRDGKGHQTLFFFILPWTTAIIFNPERSCSRMLSEFGGL